MLFFALLKSMNYTFFPVIVKCLFGSPDPVVPVELCEDSDWQPAAVSPHYYSYKMHQQGNSILLEGYNGSKRISMVSFTPLPVEPVDFIPLNYYASMAETSPVTRGIIVEMFKDNGTACILKDRLTISSDDKVEKRRLETDDERNTALWEVFGIKI